MQSFLENNYINFKSYNPISIKFFSSPFSYIYKNNYTFS